MSRRSYGGLQVTDGSATTQALSTTPGQMTAWSGAGGGNSVTSATWDGDRSVVPDYANSRILCVPGNYRVQFDASLLGSTTGQVVAQLRKNGVVQGHLTGRATVGTAQRGNPMFSGYLQVNPSDSPGTISQFPAPASGGPSGASKMMVPIDLVLYTTAGAVTVTVEAAHLNLDRVE